MKTRYDLQINSSACKVLVLLDKERKAPGPGDLPEVA